MLAVPLSIVLGGPLSGWLMGMTLPGGLSGWRWMYVSEALPAIAFGCVAWFYFPDRPSDARWISDAHAEAALLGGQQDPRLPRGRDLPRGGEPDRDEENEEDSEESPSENSRAPPSQVPHPTREQAKEVPRIRNVGAAESA